MPTNTCASGWIDTGPVVKTGSEPNAGISINNAIAQLPSSGGVVDARGITGSQTSGVITVNKPVHLILGNITLTFSSGISQGFNIKSSGVTIQGSGVQTILTLASSNDMIIHVGADGASYSNFVARGIRCLGLGLTPADADIAKEIGIALDNCTNYTIENCWFDSLHSGIVATDCINGEIVDNNFISTGLQAVQYKQATSNTPTLGYTIIARNVIKSVSSSGVGGMGIRVSGNGAIAAERVLVTDNLIRGASATGTAEGITLEQASWCVIRGNHISAMSLGVGIQNTSSYLTICGNTLLELGTNTAITLGESAGVTTDSIVCCNSIYSSNGTTGGITLDTAACNRNTIRGNYMYRPLIGVNVTSSFDCVIDGNLIIEPYAAAVSQGSGVRLFGTGGRCVVSNNRILKSQEQGIGIGTYDHCSIHGNIITDSGQAGTNRNAIQDSATSSYNSIIGNIMTNTGLANGNNFGLAVVGDNHMIGGNLWEGNAQATGVNYDASAVGQVGFYNFDPTTKSFTATAAATTTISDSTITPTSKVVVFPTNAAAGLLTRTKTCYVSSVALGSFQFTVSSTGAGAPAGTETFNYSY